MVLSKEKTLFAINCLRKANKKAREEMTESPEFIRKGIEAIVNENLGFLENGIRKGDFASR